MLRELGSNRSGGKKLSFEQFEPKRQRTVIKLKLTKCIKLHTRRLYAEMYIDKSTYIGKIPSGQFRGKNVL